MHFFDVMAALACGDAVVLKYFVILSDVGEGHEMMAAGQVCC